MPLLIVIGVGLLVFFYVRATRKARQAWLRKLDLPGRWYGYSAQDGEPEPGDGGKIELTLNGNVDHGEFLYRGAGENWRGEWRLVGHILKLSGLGREASFDLHFFKAGTIGLQDARGERQLFSKVIDNVVPLRREKGA